MARRLGLPLAPVLPVDLCPLPGPLYAVLMGYKEAPVQEARVRFASLIRDDFAAFFGRHLACLEAALGGPVDLAVPVPSTSRRGGAPMARVGGLAELIGSLGPATRWSPAALVRAAGPVGHMHPNRDAFAVAEVAGGTVRGARVLVLDDTYVSGARAQSAAAALRKAGARSTLIVPLGRVLRPDRSAGHAAFLAGRPDARPGAADRCARCVLPRPVASPAAAVGHRRFGDGRSPG
ncbi:MAG TPA: hypothetical protein VGL48_09185 [Acidimicrobiales bacterium]